MLKWLYYFSNKVDFRAKKIAKRKIGLLHNDKWVIHQEEMIILREISSNNMVSKNIKRYLTEMKDYRDKTTIIVVVFSTLLSVIDRKTG